MGILGALEMVQFLEGLFMDMEQQLLLEQLQATEREVIGKVIHNDKPKVISIHMKHPEFYIMNLLANTNYTMCCGLPQAGSGTLDPIHINFSMILKDKNHN